MNSGFFSSMYYVLFSKAFRRENQAVLYGKHKYLKTTSHLSFNRYQLVRNIHRLEKGLIMKPRRPLFAKDYIKETVENFIEAWPDAKNRDDHQIIWAHDILNLYFELTTKEDELVDGLRKQFNSALTGDHHHTKVPYRRDTISVIPYDDLYKLSKQRRSVRWFLKKKVPRELIDKAIQVAMQSPSACNRQPFEYRVIDDQEMLEELVTYPMGTKGYGHNIPVMIVVIGNLDAYFDERDRHLIYIDASLANMAFMYALETLGLSSCPINWPDIESRERKMEKFLKLGKHQRPVMCIGLGYPDPEEKVAFSEKKDLDSIRKYN
ncbi:MAG: nitroreductase family protein [Balneolales bacterium]